jgi:PAS domain S-box-containing protein
MSILKNLIPESYYKLSKKAKPSSKISDPTKTTRNNFQNSDLTRAIFDASQDALFVIQHGAIVECNKKTLVMFDCKSNELIGQQPHMLSPLKQSNGQLSKDKAEKKIQSALRGNPQVFDWVHKKFDGTLFDAEVSLSSCRHLGEDFVVAAVRDLTGREKAKTALAKSEAKYRALVDGASEAILVAQDGIIKFNNTKSEELVGSSNKELLGKAFADFLHPDDKEMVLENYKKRMQNEPVVSSYNFRLVAKSNQVKWARLSVTLIEWENRPATLNFLTDITSQIDAEKAGRETERLMRIIAENYPHSFVALVDKNLKIIYIAGQEAQKRLSRVSYTGKRIQDIFAVEGDALVQQIKTIAELTFAGKEQSINLKTKKYHLRVKTVPLLNENGDIDQILGVLENITEQMEAEQKSNENEKKFRLTFDNASDAIYLLELTKQGPIIREANTAALQSHGYTKAELIGKPSSMLAAHQRRSLISGVVEKILKGEHVRYEALDVRKDGSTFPVEISARLATMNNTPYVLSIERDISDRKKAELKLREHHALLNATLDSTGDGILVEIGTKRVVKANKKFFQMWGIPDHIAVTEDRTAYGKIMLDQLVDPNNYESRIKEIENSGKDSLDIFHLKDGRVFELYSNPMNFGENITGRAISFRDVSQRINAEIKIKELNEILQLQMKRMPIGLIVFNSEFKITSWNPAAEHIFGYTAEEIIGTHPFDSIVPKHIKEDIEEIWKLLRDGDTPEKYINENLTKDKRRIICQWTNTPLLDDNGKIHGVLSMAHDITEKKDAETQLEKYQAHLEELVQERTHEIELKTDKMKQAQKAMRYLVEDANEARQQIEETNELLSESNKQLESFAYSVSHDLRAPLRAISGFANKLSRLYNNDLDSEGQRILNVINDNTKKMSQLIDDLLSFSRISRALVNTTKVDMAALAKDISVELRMANPLLKIDFNIGPLYKTLGDQRLLRQALYNLMENAVKYSSRKDKPHIQVSMVDKDGEFAYCVRDNGVGFDMKYVDKLFNVFQRLHAETEFKGTGVGLAITQLIINRHNGRVWADAKLDKGARFYFTLPRADENKIEGGK